jgi:6,7-dimethyl-8-ribityllumazine synthase
VAQAIERADPAKFNRGGEAAKSAIEMASVMRLLNTSDRSRPSKAAVRSNGARQVRRRSKN